MARKKSLTADDRKTIRSMASRLDATKSERASVKSNLMLAELVSLINGDDRAADGFAYARKQISKKRGRK